MVAHAFSESPPSFPMASAGIEPFSTTSDSIALKPDGVIPVERAFAANRHTAPRGHSEFELIYAGEGPCFSRGSSNNAAINSATSVATVTHAPMRKLFGL